MSSRTDNVIPIDAESARHLARAARRFRRFVGLLTAVWLAALASVVVLTPLPPLAPLVALSVLALIAEHRFVLFDDETSMSASIVVIVASVFLFSDTAPFAGPMLVASIGGLYLPLLRRREWAKVLTNSAALGLPAVGSATISLGIHNLTLDPGSKVLFSAVAIVLTYWVSNNGIIASYLNARYEQSLLQNIRSLCTSETYLLCLAFLSAILSSQYQHSVMLCYTTIAFIVAYSSVAYRARGAKDIVPLQAALIGIACYVIATYIKPGTLITLWLMISLLLNIARFSFRKPEERMFYSTATLALLLPSMAWSMTLAIGASLLCIIHRISPTGASLLLGSALGSLATQLTTLYRPGARCAVLIVGIAFVTWISPPLFQAMFTFAQMRARPLTAMGLAIPTVRDSALFAIICVVGYLCNMVSGFVGLYGIVIVLSLAASHSTVMQFRLSAYR